MTQKPRNVTTGARESAEKAAYAAVGAPAAALKALSARVSDLRDTVRTSRQELSSEIAREIDEWIEEGEQVIDRAMTRIRGSDVTDDVRATLRSTRKTARAGIDMTAAAIGRGIGLVDPDESLTAIKGVGPSYRDQLGKAGITGISSFLVGTATEEDRSNLAAMSGVSADMIETWRAQADLTRIEGVGEANELLLHRAGVWTLDQLVAAEPSVLAREMRSVTLPDVPEQRPAEPLIQRWQQAARGLLGSKATSSR
jgi:predicted flap endonuclease-1-like 5' DNA nuclease